MTSPYASKPWLLHYKVPAEIQTPVASLVDVFEATVHRAPTAPAIYYFDREISFERLNEQASRFAAMLAGWGIGRGDRVALAFQNDPQFAIAQLGAWKRGAIVIPLNPMYKQRELDFYLADSGARAWVGLDTLNPAEHNLDFSLPVSIDDPEMNSALARFEPDESARMHVGPDDIAYLAYTSGTTGEPKGAMCLHRHILYNAEVYRAWMEIGTGDVILGLAALFHITGLVSELALSTLTGVPLILFHRFDAARALELSERWGATVTVAAITAYIALMRVAGRTAHLPAKCYSGGAPVPLALARDIESQCGVYIHNVYGLTESNSPSHMVPLGLRAPVDCTTGALSIGVPVPNCEAKIVDPDNPARQLPVGEVGELALKGPMIFSGYWNKPEATEAAFCGGFFLTGDMALMDAAGWFYIVDRKKDMIIASGFKIWPREVEDVLYEHPAVREAAVIGVPDSYRGENVKAVVALRDGFETRASDIIAFCRERLAVYKCPRMIEVVPEIPKTATGKILRRSLRGPTMTT